MMSDGILYTRCAVKIINEGRFNIQTRPYSWHGKSYLGVAIFVLADFDEEGCYLGDYKTIWDEQLSVMNEGAALDNFMSRSGFASAPQ